MIFLLIEGVVLIDIYTYTQEAVKCRLAAVVDVTDIDERLLLLQLHPTIMTVDWVTDGEIVV